MSTFNPTRQSRRGRKPQDRSEEDALHARLVREFLSGRESAFDELHRSLNGFAHSAAARAVLPEDAPDIVSIAWDKCVRSLRGYNPSLRFTTWFGTIVRNTAVDRIRHIKRRLKLDSDFIAQPHEEEYEDRTVERNDDSAFVRGALAQLTLEQRQTLTFVYFDGLTMREVSAATGEPLGTVKARARRGLEQLRRLLGATGKPRRQTHRPRRKTAP